MTRPSIWVGLVVTTLAPAAALAQGLEIDHKAVGCIVVGKFPKMNACVAPAASLARSRVYFRPEGTPSWYYVDMKSDQPCLSGILPRPGKKLVGKKIEYYVEAQNKAFTPSRTAEYAPVVVRSAQECRKDIPVAPFVNNATVAVFPSVPAGFVGGGVGTAGAVGIVAAGTAAVGTAAVVATGNDDNGTTTTTIAASVNTTTTAPAPTTTTTTIPPHANGAPRAILKTSPDPPSGISPLTVTFDLCSSTDPDGDPLSFFFDFGDGSKASGDCSVSHTYTAPALRRASGVAAQATFGMSASAVDPSNASDTKERTVAVDPPTPTTTTTTTTTTTSSSSTTTSSFSTTTTTILCNGPTVFFNNPANGACSLSNLVPVDVTATDPSGIASVIVKGDFVGQFLGGTCLPLTPVTESTQTATGTPPNYSATLTLVPAVAMPKCYKLIVSVQSTCGANTTLFRDFVLAFSSCTPTPQSRDLQPAAWASDLSVEGARLQVVVNGSTVSYPQAGRGYGMAAFAAGENRVEATVVEGRGKPGLWRFEVLASHGIAAGSIRVFSGDVVAIAESSVTFRLKGTPGERIAFAFHRR